MRISRRIAAQSPLREILTGELPPSAECDSDAEIIHYIRGHCTTLYHPSSTCRMGTDRMAVVDPASMKVHGLEGLRVSDASVIPKMVSSNINAPTIMIAERGREDDPGVMMPAEDARHPHPSSDLAPRGHLLPQGEKGIRSLLPLREKVAFASAKVG